MSRAERSRRLLRALARARYVCERVRAETGALLPDDECAVALAATELALDLHDLDAGYDRRAPPRPRGEAANGKDGPPC